MQKDTSRARLQGFVGRILCRHEWHWVDQMAATYNDKVIMTFDVYRCSKCKKLKLIRTPNASADLPAVAGKVRRDVGQF